MTEWITHHRSIRVFSGLLLFMLSVTSIAILSAERSDPDPALQFSDPWVRQMPPMTRMRAGYVQIHNSSNEVISIIGVRSADFELAEIHRSIEIDGRYRMQLAQPLEVAAGHTIELKPKGLHVMLIRPVEPAPEDQIDIEFQLSNDQSVVVTFDIRS